MSEYVQTPSANDATPQSYVLKSGSSSRRYRAMDPPVVPISCLPFSTSSFWLSTAMVQAWPRKS